MISRSEWPWRRWSLAAVLVLGLGLYMRTSGLFSGLQEGAEWHPDVPKQIRRLGQYMQGNHTVYSGGDMFYDGYAYGLNRVDEGIIRLVRPAYAVIRKHFIPGAQSPGFPDNDELYYWARSLRVLYGMLVLLAAMVIARMAGLSRWGGLLACLLIGIAPLSITVSHMGTGDVGVDLFTAGTILFTVLWAAGKRSVPSTALAAACVGLAFASKYHGLLTLFVPGTCLLVRYGIVERKPARLFVFGVCIALAFVAAVVVANPLFLHHPLRTWSELQRNIVFIKNYGVSHAFLNLPLSSRVAISLHDNIPKILGVVGWALSCLAATGLLLSVREVWRNRGALKDNQMIILKLVVFLYPFVFILLSAAGKPEFSPYHFSSIVLPLAISATCATSFLLRSPRATVRILAAACVVAMLVESGMVAMRDNTFWSRDYIKVVGDSMAREFVPTPKAAGEDARLAVRRLRLERGSVSVSRNKPFTVSVLRGDRWTALGVPPVPCVPYPRNFDWIFLNGPMFPRNDRMYRIPRGSSDSRDIVMDNKPSVLRLGVRSGLRQAKVAIKAGGCKQTITLPPDSAEVVTLTAPDFRSAHTRDSDVYMCSLLVTADYGDAWVTVLGSDRETDNFLLFSGQASASQAARVEAGCGAEEISELVDHALYMEGESGIWHKMSQGETQRLFNAALGAGVYKLEFEVVPLSADTAIRVVGRDLFNRELPVLDPAMTNVISVAVSGTVTAKIEKTYAPYEVSVELSCTAGSCMVNGWRLRPDSTAIISGIKSYAGGASAPAWLDRPRQTRLPSNHDKLGGTMFGAGVELEDASFPSEVKAGSNEFLCLMHVKPLAPVEILRYDVFLHFLDVAGRQQGTSGVKLLEAVCAGASGLLLSCEVPGNLAVGEYEVWMGVYNTDTGDRLPVSARSGGGIAVDSDNRILIGRTTVLPPGKTKP